MKRIQKGFTTLEMLLVIIMLAIIGFTGYYVYHSKQQTDKTLNAAQADNASAPSTKLKSSTSKSPTTQKYFTITQWGVRAPYNGNLNLSYTIGSGSDSNMATFSSQELTSADSGCSGRGGFVTRYLGTDSAIDFNQSDKTIAQFAAEQGQSTYGHAGDYYYFFAHDQAACGTDINATQSIQEQTNDVVKGLVPNLQAIPQ